MADVSGLRTASPEVVLRVQGLQVAFRTSAGLLQAVRGVDFEVGVGETVALVGESGSGKSASVLGMLGLFHPESALVRAERLEFEDAAIVDADRSTLRSLLGRRIGVVFQDPQSSLNPTMRVGRQIGEVIRLHEHRSRSEVKAKVLTSAGGGGHTRSARMCSRLPASVEWRHASAGNDCDGDDRQSITADRR